MVILEYIQYEAKNKKIIIKIPAASKGKIMFKTRDNNIKFGDSFSARQSNFNENVYLEWQIGYDATLSDIKKDKKDTKLKKLSFIGANKKEKYPYELSELLYEGLNIGLISINNISKLLNEICHYNEFIDDKKIDIQYNSDIVINGISFKETSISLPTLFMVETTDDTQIEVSTQKQQYASGVQPMLYFCIPITSFQNYRDIMDRPSKLGDKLIYIIDNNNANVLFDMMKIFSMCSKRHNFDVIEILKILLKLYGINNGSC